MDAVIKKINKEQYLCKINSNDPMNKYEYTSNINNALVYTSKGVAREIAKGIANSEVLTLYSIKQQRGSV